MAEVSRGDGIMWANGTSSDGQCWGRMASQVSHVPGVSCEMAEEILDRMGSAGWMSSQHIIFVLSGEESRWDCTRPKCEVNWERFAIKVISKLPGLGQPLI